MNFFESIKEEINQSKKSFIGKFGDKFTSYASNRKLEYIEELLDQQSKVFLFLELWGKYKEIANHLIEEKQKLEQKLEEIREDFIELSSIAGRAAKAAKVEQDELQAFEHIIKPHLTR